MVCIQNHRQQLVYLQIHHLILVGSASIVLKTNAAEPDHEFNQLHLVGSFLIDNRVHQRLHRLCKNDTALHLRDVDLALALGEDLTALLQSDIFLLVVREGVIDFFYLRFVLLKNVVDLHVVALEATEGFTIHFF